MNEGDPQFTIGRDERAGLPLRGKQIEGWYTRFGLLTRPTHRLNPYANQEIPRSFEERNRRALTFWRLNLKRFLDKHRLTGAKDQHDKAPSTVQIVEEKLNRYADAEDKLTLIRDLPLKTEYGDVLIHYADTEPVSIDEENEAEPTVVIPGACNHPNDFLSFTTAYAAETGGRVIVLGYPEEITATMPKAFGEAVMRDTDYTCAAHVAVFKQAIHRLLPNKKFKLIGFSAGGLIAVRFLQDIQADSLASNITDTLLLSTSGANPIDKPFQHPKALLNSVGGGLADLAGTIPSAPYLPQYSYAIDRETDQSEDWRRKNAIYHWWIASAKRDVIDLEHTHCEGNLVMVTPQSDYFMGTSEYLEQGRQNGTLNHVMQVSIPGGHTAAMFQAEKLVPQLIKYLS